MCMSATCSTCSKKTWRGCGLHIPSALSGTPEDQWCTCEPRVTIGDKEYPPAAKVQIPGMSWLTGGMMGGSGDQKTANAKDEV